MQAQNSAIKPGELKYRIESGEKLLILDVREREEYRDWHIKGSVNIPMKKIVGGSNLNIPKKEKIVTICMHGMRSEKARQILADRGYNASVMQGGMIAWNSVYDISHVKEGNVNVVQFRRIGKGCMSYMIWNGKEALAIDPTIDVNVYAEFAEARKLRIVGVFDTHAQADHVSGGYELSKIANTGYFGPKELGNKIKYKIVNEDSRIAFGDAELLAMGTPGHTPSSTTYLVEDIAFTGDTLFVESVGRPDLGQDASSNAAILWETLHGKFLNLSSDIRIFPTHYSDKVEIVPGIPVYASMAELKQRLRALSMGKNEFIEWVAKNTPLKPNNFGLIKKINKGLIKIQDEGELRDLEAGPNRCAVK
ncbi:MAG: MBL fold metallo-hydrolase [Candidatus Aenigmarchaeota archaeon]|nr:MBL fold metallo-hydrolase [Candidatus Aenigmarchaeota archaeon]